MGGQFNCPHCGQTWIIMAPRQRAVQQSRQFQSSSFWKLNPDTNAFEPQNDNDAVSNDLSEFRAPARPPTVESDVRTPFLQAIITGAFLAPIAAGVLYEVGKAPLVLACTAGTWVCIGGAWMIRMNVMTKLLWTIEKYTNQDLNKDKHKGKPPETQERSRTVIERKGSAPRLPESWLQLEAEQQVLDVYFFAETVWNRQQSNLGTGQKALRGTALPSGFEMTDDIHGWILKDLDDAGVIRHNGSNWRLEAPPSVVKKLIRAEQW